jgi:hypothetical protein
MIVDNRLATAKLKIFYMIMLGMLFAITAFFLFEDEGYMIYPMAAIILTYLFFVLRKSDYFFLEFAGNKITVRFYTAHPFLRKYKAFEIPKSYFYDYQLRSTLGGYIQTLQFIVKTPQGKFNYPPLSISLLNKEKKAALIKILNELKSA